VVGLVLVRILEGTLRLCLRLRLPADQLQLVHLVGCNSRI
jgi:hypothetical protein